MSGAEGTLQTLFGSTVPGMISRPLLRGRASIFMLHRFSVPDLGVQGHDPTALDRVLAELRRQRVRLASLEELFTDMAAGRRTTGRVVAFTIDDGYLDQATIGAAIFAKYDCPVTMFVTSGFLDRIVWFWWDRIAWVFANTPRRSLTVTLGDMPIRYDWTSDAGRARAQDDFTKRCKGIPEAAKLVGIAALAAAAEVELPGTAPAAYAPMSWGDLRRCEQSGMRFGPHTVTHPVLAHTSDEQSRYELTESWRRLRMEARHPQPIFCYPNGQLEDFGDRELATLRSIGVTGGVVGVTGYAGDEEFRATSRAPYLVRRFAYEQSLPATMQIVNGVERAKQLLKGWR